MKEPGTDSRKNKSKNHRNRITVRAVSWILAGALIFMNPQTALAGVADSSALEPALHEKIDDYLTDTIPKTHFPSFSVTIVAPERSLFSKTYGGMGSNDTTYLVGSVSKSFTAICIMQLVEQGKIKLDAPLSAYLPDAPDGDRISVLQLLNHTSGLGEHQNLTDYRIVNPQGVHVYANVNYSLLGKIVEAVSGRTYEDYVTENVFVPLGLRHTFADPHKAAGNGLMQGYENLFGFMMKTGIRYRDSEDAWITVPAGYISSSTNDLGRYLQMYLNGGEGILSEDSIREMFYNGVEVEDDIPYRYGMGWNLIQEPLKHPVLRHSGLVENGMSCIYILPEEQLGVAVTVNANDYFVGGDLADRIGWGLILLLMEEEPEQIGAGEYFTRHLLYDLIYLFVILVAVFPLILLPVYQKRIRKGNIRGVPAMIGIAALHVGFPVFLLLLTRLFFKTPLWVVRAFVPDLYAVILLSATLLFAGGMIKFFMLMRQK